jgi:hypothetical protein
MPEPLLRAREEEEARGRRQVHLQDDLVWHVGYAVRSWDCGDGANAQVHDS